MKFIQSLFFILIGIVCLANMASPIRKGTAGGSAISSRDIDILSEKIFVRIEPQSKTAVYTIEYYINTDTAGRQIPLLFHAKDYQGDCKIWVDNREVPLQEIPDEIFRTGYTPFEKFSGNFEQPSAEGGSEQVMVYWEKNRGEAYELKDLKYFEADLEKGTHLIKVEYVATAWTDRSDWVKEYSFLYSLSPAKHWKSFGSLEIIVDVTGLHQSITTNLGKPAKGTPDSIAVWQFSELPADYFKISFTPEISRTAKTLMALGPMGIAMIISMCFMALHFIALRKFRIRYPAKRSSWVLLVGSIVVPFVALMSFIFSFELIDAAIGDDAGRYHGYTVLVIGLYPVLLAVYWIVMWCVDKLLKKWVS